MVAATQSTSAAWKSCQGPCPISQRQELPCSAVCATLVVMATKHPTSIRLSSEAARLRRLLAHKLGISKTAVVELALREKAAHEHIDEEHADARVAVDHMESSC